MKDAFAPLGRLTFRLLGTAIGVAGAILGAMCHGGAAEPPGTPPAVIASIAPVHSLTAMVMEGVGTPRLLLPKGSSPHGYALRPSDARALAGARLVVWIGPALERFLAKPLTVLVGHGSTLALLESPGLIRYPARRGGTWPDHEAHDSHDDPKGGHGDHGAAHAGEVDPHVWLDPRNGRAMVRAIAKALARVDPVHGARYEANARRAEARLETLDARLAALLKPVAAIPYIVFHDAYRYFEARYGLNAVGSIVVSADRRPGIKRLKAIRARVRETGAVCVFAEPQFSPGITATVVEDTSARIGVLDPLGSALAPGSGLYDMLLGRLADDLAGCLKGRPVRR